MTTNTTLQTTAGSLLEQAANFSPKLAGQRLTTDRGFEASSVGAITFRLYSPVEEAAEQILDRALREASTPGEAQTVEATAKQIDEKAVLTREVVRTRKVMGLVPETARQINRVITETLPVMTPYNATEKAGEVLNRSHKVIDTVKAGLENDLRCHYFDAAVIERLGEATQGSDASVATLLAAFGILRGRAEKEPDAIDKKLKELEEQVKHEQQRLLVAVSETRGGLFGMGRNEAINHARAVVSATVPVLGNARLGYLYLPLVRNGMPAVVRGLDHERTLLERRREAIEDTLRQLFAHRASRVRKESARGRVQILGAPATAAQRAADVDKLVWTAWPSLARTLRDLITWKAPAERLLAELFEPTLAELWRQVPSRTLDDALFVGRAEDQVAQEFDRAVRAAAVPLGLVPGTDRTALAQTHCLVLRVPQGSRLKAALIRHCKYDPGRIAEIDAQDHIDVLQWQLGISIEDTDLHQRSADVWDMERNDPAAPPLHTLPAAFMAPSAATMLATTRKGSRNAVPPSSP